MVIPMIIQGPVLGSSPCAAAVVAGVGAGVGAGGAVREAQDHHQQQGRCGSHRVSHSAYFTSPIFFFVNLQCFFIIII